MKQATVLFAMILLIFAFPASAQKKKKSAPKVVTLNEVPPPDSMPEITDFAFVVNIDKNSNITLQAQKAENSGVLTNASDAKTLKAIFSGASSAKSALDPILIVKADPFVNYSDVLAVLNAFRASPKQRAKVEISKGFFAYIPPKQGKTNSRMLTVTPLQLIVGLNKEGKLDVNGEPMDDVGHVQNFLKKIFKAREDNGVFREGTNELETTVLIKAPPTVKFAEVVKIAEALKEAGSTLVGLAVDDSGPMQNIIIETNQIRL